MKRETIPITPAEWMTLTRGLTATEAGVYTAILCKMLTEDDVLPYDCARLHRLCGTASVAECRRAVDALIAVGLLEDEGGWLTCDTLGRWLVRDMPPVTSSLKDRGWLQ